MSNGFIRVSGYSQSDIETAQKEISNSVTVVTLLAQGRAANQTYWSNNYTCPNDGIVTACLGSYPGNNNNYVSGYGLQVNGSTVFNGAQSSNISVKKGDAVRTFVRCGSNDNEGVSWMYATVTTWEH